MKLTHTSKTTAILKILIEPVILLKLKMSIMTDLQLLLTLTKIPETYARVIEKKEQGYPENSCIPLLFCRLNKFQQLNGCFGY